LGHTSGSVALFGNGMAHFLRKDLSEPSLRALITRNGGEAVDLSKLD
jgi:hypothetical protein